MSRPRWQPGDVVRYRDRRGLRRVGVYLGTPSFCDRDDASRAVLLPRALGRAATAPARLTVVRRRALVSTVQDRRRP